MSPIHDYSQEDVQLGKNMMTSPQNVVFPVIIFLKAPDNASKMAHICMTIQSHFDQGHRVLITVPSMEAAHYVDQLLWRYPEESFLPHVISQKPLKESVLITTEQENLNQATVLFNLCPAASPICAQFTTVYELFDETHLEKLRLSEIRHKAYQAQGFMTSVKEL